MLMRVIFCPSERRLSSDTYEKHSCLSILTSSIPIALHHASPQIAVERKKLHMEAIDGG